MLARKARRLLGAGLSVTVAATGITLWASGGRPDKAIDNASLNPSVCMVTRSSDPLNAGLVTATWSALQEAAERGMVNAQRIPVPSAATNTALPYLNGAVSRNCRLLIAVGAPLAPVLERAARTPRQTRFVLVGAQARDSDIVSITGLTGQQLTAKIGSLLPSG